MTNKIKHVNITFECKNGKYELSECKKIPSIEEINDLLIPAFAGVGLGTIKSIVIDNIEM